MYIILLEPYSPQIHLHVPSLSECPSQNTRCDTRVEEVRRGDEV